MNLGYAHGNRLNQQFDFLEDYEVEEIFSDDTQSYGVFQDPESDYQRMLDYTEPGDCIVIAFLEVISRDYQVLLKFFNELEDLELDLIVLTSPELTLLEWREVLLWIDRNDRLVHPRLIKLKLKQEKSRNKETYSAFSKDSEAKRLYRGVMWQLLGKQKLRTIAEQKGVPIETIYRIQQEFKRVKLAGILAICFFLAIATLKITENFSDNLWIQIVVCVVTTLAILYNTLADDE
ncbi:recombinase family protein [Enterococcus caccae]|uniref:Resolvase/invertase-type recombinase catalytic domain-containing protein n=1 Tax=Enterococcus caccae ATCC BAA-1240 TaxID=1158612 RepID=R3WJT5_9ENTE|nr:recombinase family protein [Enterococcus caccae]EOL47712.1 hypothetical protein UC7_00962 [Enterococcus caccae ATCC BAA-1240]EOT65510.1 hypothetical protein I580_01266 [Enterococcus caccae ATCC BAA-1240]OJG27309.1 hypothetical protein RU98_GL002761 [Enterococcus caccae]